MHQEMQEAFGGFDGPGTLDIDEFLVSPDYFGLELKSHEIINARAPELFAEANESGGASFSLQPTRQEDIAGSNGPSDTQVSSEWNERDNHTSEMVHRFSDGHTGLFHGHHHTSGSSSHANPRSTLEAHSQQQQQLFLTHLQLQQERFDDPDAIYLASDSTA